MVTQTNTNMVAEYDLKGREKSNKYIMCVLVHALVVFFANDVHKCAGTYIIVVGVRLHYVFYILPHCVLRTVISHSSSSPHPQRLSGSILCCVRPTKKTVCNIENTCVTDHRILYSRYPYLLCALFWTLFSVPTISSAVRLGTTQKRVSTVI